MKVVNKQKTLYALRIGAKEFEFELGKVLNTDDVEIIYSYDSISRLIYKKDGNIFEFSVGYNGEYLIVNEDGIPVDRISAKEFADNYMILKEDNHNENN